MQPDEKPELHFTVSGIPRPKGSMRAFLPKGSTRPIVTANSPNLRGWENEVRHVARQAADETAWKVPPRERAVSVTMLFMLPKPKTTRRIRPCTKPDIDKLVRAVLDGLTGPCFDDDASVTDLHACKMYVPYGWQAGVVVRVTTL